MPSRYIHPEQIHSKVAAQSFHSTLKWWSTTNHQKDFALNLSEHQHNDPEVKPRPDSQLFGCPKVPVGQGFALLGMFLGSHIKSGVFVQRSPTLSRGSAEGTRDGVSPSTQQLPGC